jgi:UDP-N-acetylmuramate dehydrogenase
MDLVEQTLKRLKQGFRGKIFLGEPLSKHTSFRIGGPADYYVYPKDLEDLGYIVDFCQREQLPRFTIGNGTNLLVSDQGFRGVVIDLSETFNHIQCKGHVVTVGAGVALDELLKYCIQRGLSGLECLVGIPGQVGGAIRLNAGAWGGEIYDRLLSVRFLDRFGTLERRQREEITAGYRYTDLPSDAIIVEAQFHLAEGNPKEMEALQDSYMKERRQKQPLSLPSAGSVFKRPEGDFAGRLIEYAGCKGLRIGDAMVSKKHANFIVNCHLASAEDVIRLMNEIQDRVMKRFGVELEPEIHTLGFTSR